MADADRKGCAGSFAGALARCYVGTMRWLRGSFVIMAVAAAGCDQLRGGQSAPAPPAAEAAPAPEPIGDLAEFGGRSFIEFVAAHRERFDADALGLSDSDLVRLQGAMEISTGAVQRGGGAEALVFRGCAASGCGDAVAVVAIDGATGGAFVGVRDNAGEVVLAPNERLEALLRLNAPTRDWVDAGPAPETSETAPERP